MWFWCQRKFNHKFSGFTVPSIGCIHNIINKARSTESLLDKKAAEKQHVLTEEKLDEKRG
jgi:hypothetical protein